MSNFKGFDNVRYKKMKIDAYGNKTVIGKENYALEELEGFMKEPDSAVAMIVPDGCVVVDVDDKKEGQALINCIKDQEIKCFISESTKGYHFYFQIPRGMKIKNNTRVSTPVGLTCIDYRSGQAHSLIIEYRNLKWADWIIEPQSTGLDPFMDLDELPFWLYPLINKRGQMQNINSMCGMTEGDGRNNTLNAHRSRLVALFDYNQEQVRLVFHLINEFVFERPLPKQELDTVGTFRDIDKKEVSERWFDKNGHFLHHEMGEFLMENMSVYHDTYDCTYYFNNEYYTMDDKAIEKKIVAICPQLIERQRNEVIKYVKLAEVKNPIQPLEYHSWICCKNCLVDAMTGNTLGFTPSIFVTNQLDVEYNPTAYDANVDKFLNETLVDKGDKEQRMIFEEYLGYTLIAQDNWAKKMLFMIGPNAFNGKSTTLSMIQKLLTLKNCSNVKLSQISESNAHVLTELCDKQANIDDDADNSVIKGSTMSYLKTIISDENKITINPKYKQPFQKFIKAKFWIATNHIIKTEQKGNEWMGRLLILAYNNQFQGANQDPFLKNKLSTPNAKSYLLKLAIEGYQRLMKQGQFTVSAESEKWVKQYKIENDTVFKFLFTRKYSDEHIKDKTLKSLFMDYKNYLEEEDIAYSVNLNNFEKRLLEYYENRVTIEVQDNERVLRVNSNV